MSPALSTMSLTHGFRFTGRMQTQMIGVSLDASPGLDLLKKGDSLCSLHATYMLSKNPLLICTKPLYAVDRQCSFLAFTLQSDKRKTENHRVRARTQEDDDMGDDDMEDDDMEDALEYLETDFLTSFPDVSNGRPKIQEKMSHKHIKADAVSESEIVTSCLKSESKPKEDNHDNGQTVQMSDAKAKSALDRILTILRQNRSRNSADRSRDAVSKVKSSNGNPSYNISYSQDSIGKPPYNTSYAQGSNGKMPSKTSYVQGSNGKLPYKTSYVQGSNGKLPYKTSYAKSVARQRNSKPKDSDHLNDKGSVDAILEVLQKSPPQKHEEKKTSPYTVPVIRQQEQVATIGFQPENSGFADDSLNVGHDNEKQLKSAVQHDASHVIDFSSITAVKVGENESLMNDNALQIDSSDIQQVDPSTLTVKELWKVAKANGLTGFYKLKKVELLELLKNQKVDTISTYK